MEDNNEQLVSGLQKPAFKSRRGGLIAFGVIQILIAGFVFLMAGAVLLVPTDAIAKTQPPNAAPVSLIGIAIFYGLIGLVFLILGIGSIQAKNWARIGTLVISWFWLAMGVVTLLIAVFVMLGILRNSPAPQQNLPANFNQMVVVVMMIFTSAFFVALPGAFLLFYHGKNVKATCEQGLSERSPHRRPTLLTILGWWFGIGVLGAMYGVFAKYPAVVYGFLIWGIMGKLLILAMGAAYGFASWGFFRRDLRGWWTAILLHLFWIGSTVVTFFNHDVVQLYRQMGMTEQELHLFETTPHILQFTIWGSIILMVVTLLFVVYSKRYFGKETAS